MALLKRALLLAGVPLAILVLIVAAWALDARGHDGEALRGVELGGRDVGGMDRTELADATAAIASSYDDAEIVVHTDDGDITTNAAAVGLTVDVAATVEQALEAGRDDALPVRPLRWLTSLVGGRETGVVVNVDRARVRALVAAEDPTDRTEPIEPGIVGDDGEVAVVLGEDGEGIDAEDVADAIESEAAHGAIPIEVTVEPGTISPRFSRADAEALAERAKELTSGSLVVQVGGTDAEIPGSMIRSWLSSEAGDDGLELALESEEVIDDLDSLFADIATAPADARFTVQGGRPVILEGVRGRACCESTAVGFILGAVKAGHDGPIDLPMREVDPDQTSEELEALGIVEQIGSFTTNHKCCEGRVTNIHRIADIVRGAVIQPGASWSVNEVVGERTTEKGFVSGGVIENGSFVESIGGGISQFATTTFNAAFFGGLDLEAYQSHSIYITRYPYGREATLSFPKPDLVIGNETPHGVLIWPTYTDTSLTVTLYSTRYARGEQTAQSEAPVGVAGCTRVTTERTRTYVDGRTEVDKVYAVYRPGEGIKCDGPPNQTTTTTTTTTPGA